MYGANFLLQAALLLSQMPLNLVGEAMPEENLFDAVNFILSLQVSFLHFQINLYHTFAISFFFQNNNGGFASYELTRSYPWLEVKPFLP